MKIRCMKCGVALEVNDAWNVGLRGQSWSSNMLGQYSDNDDYIVKNMVKCGCGQEQCPACWDPTYKTRPAGFCQCSDAEVTE